MRGAGVVASPPGSRGGAGNGSNGNGVVGSISDFANDVATLAELQAKLAAADLRQTADQVAIPLIVVASAAAIVLAALTVGMLGVADLIVLLLNVSPGTAKLITAAVGLGLSALLAYVSLGGLSRSLEPLRRSREELTRNLAWLKTVLVYSGRAYPRRRV